MDDLVQVSVIHFFDVRRRETLCGLRGFEHRSTKHARGVTCPACVGLLHSRLEPEAAPSPDQGVARPRAHEQHPLGHADEAGPGS